MLPVKIDGTDDARNRTLEIPSISIGTMRTSGAWIILMLMAEDPFVRPQIILDVMGYLGISIQNLQAWADDKPCPECGISLLLHDGRECP